LLEVFAMLFAKLKAAARSMEVLGAAIAQP
jgi:hypothetical protein